MVWELEVVKTTGKSLGRISVNDSATVKDLKQEISKKFKILVERQSIRNGPKSKDVKDSEAVGKINFESPGKIFVKDLGPQISWNTVFYCEYAGPIFVYGLFYWFPACFYSDQVLSEGFGETARNTFPFNLFPLRVINSYCSNVDVKVQSTVVLASYLWTFHYVKRILETAFVHKFSHGTMPIFNLFKNCSYYWSFAGYISYHVNHPLHTEPPLWMIYLGTAIFIFCELGNLSVHILLSNLRPAGTTVRKIPLPDANPFNGLFNYVSCPNYTYEYGSWIGFSLLTGALPAFLFALAGLYQMGVWAVGKHKSYIREFPNYPKARKAILPFVW